MHSTIHTATGAGSKDCTGITPSLDQVTVITVTFQSVGIVEAMAQTLTHFPKEIAIDNANKGGTAGALLRYVPHEQIIRNQENYGFGRANNQAVALVTTPYVLLLDPDRDISSADLLRLVATVERYPAAAIVAPQSWLAADRPQRSYRQAFYERRAGDIYRIADGSISAKWLNGCCMLIRVDAFRRFGGFDERFFLYYEDDDICLRALRAGYDCLLGPVAQVLHQGGASSAPSSRTDFLKYFHLMRSRRLIISKYLSGPAGSLYRIETVLIAPFATLVYILFWRRKYAIKWFAWGRAAWTGS